MELRVGCYFPWDSAHKTATPFQMESVDYLGGKPDKEGHVTWSTTPFKERNCSSNYFILRLCDFALSRPVWDTLMTPLVFVLIFVGLKDILKLLLLFSFFFSPYILVMFAF